MSDSEKIITTVRVCLNSFSEEWNSIAVKSLFLTNLLEDYFSRKLMKVDLPLDVINTLESRNEDVSVLARKLLIEYANENIICLSDLHKAQKFMDNMSRSVNTMPVITSNNLSQVQRNIETHSNTKVSNISSNIQEINSSSEEERAIGITNNKSIYNNNLESNNILEEEKPNLVQEVVDEISTVIQENNSKEVHKVSLEKDDNKVEEMNEAELVMFNDVMEYSAKE